MHFFKRKRPFPVSLVFLYYTRRVSGSALWNFTDPPYYTGRPKLHKSSFEYILTLVKTSKSVFMASAHLPDPYYIQRVIQTFPVSDTYWSDGFIVAVQRECTDITRALVHRVPRLTLETVKNHIDNGWYSSASQSIIRNELAFRDRCLYKETKQRNKKV